MRKEEQETILRYDALEDKWIAWSCVQKHIYAMQKKGWKQISSSDDSASFEAPSYSVKIASVEKVKKTPMSEERKMAIAKRLAEWREQQNVKKVL